MILNRCYPKAKLWPKINKRAFVKILDNLELLLKENRK